MDVFIYISVSSFLPSFLLCDLFVECTLKKMECFTVFFSTQRAQHVRLQTMIFKPT